jgi:hypothetical protein
MRTNFPNKFDLRKSRGMAITWIFHPAPNSRHPHLSARATYPELVEGSTARDTAPQGRTKGVRFT